MYTFSSEQTLKAPRSEVFSFFSDPANLEKLTPDYLSFQLETDEPIEMFEGQVLTYRLSLYGIPFTWQSRIDVWEPPDRFVDLQIKGPYRFWRHEHVFEETDDGTNVVDNVKYEVPGWILSPLIHWLFVRGDVERIFSYRTEQLRSIFPSE